MKKKTKTKKKAEVIPLRGKDEMNLLEFPFGPVTPAAAKTLEVDHTVFDKTLKRNVTRRLVITGSDAFGLPRPIDDRVLVGMQALTYEAGFSSRRVQFSKYRLCQVIGWKPDGRVCRRLEESLDRIAGTTLKFKDAWWDKGEQEWMSRTFHLIDVVELCSRDRLDRTRRATGSTDLSLCYFVWNEVIWKSFQDGFIRSLDMEMFRRIAQGRRREIPIRLFRVLGKKFYKTDVVTMELRKLCVGKLGLSPNYSPSQMVRIIERAVAWLVECDYLDQVGVKRRTGGSTLLTFVRSTGGRRAASRRRMRSARQQSSAVAVAHDELPDFFRDLPIERQREVEADAVAFCRSSQPQLAAGYDRHKSAGGRAFDSYRGMILRTFHDRTRDGEAA